jgi:adenylate kinase family enzyme
VTHPIFWIGGSPCSGKSTVAARLSERFGWAIYSCDDAYYRHQELIAPDRQPVYSRLSKLDGDEVWMRPVPQQIEEELEIYREEFPFILQDLCSRAKREPVIAEGAALLPELLASAEVPADRAIWLVPTPEFQLHHYAHRDWRHDVVKSCSDPEQAWRNWMARDIGFARAVAEQALRFGFRLITIDGATPVDEIVRAVEAHFSLNETPREGFAR